jgi:TPR repeat protein
MCGTPAPAIGPLQALSAIPDEFSAADHDAGVSSSDQLKPSKPSLRRLIPVIVVSIALMVFASFFHFRKGKLPEQSGPAAELTSTSERPKLESAGPRHIVHNSARGVQHLVVARPGTAQATDLAKEDDPTELWNAVKRGSVPAEVALANLYLKGEAVPQNCEQAHMLLLAASMKGSKFADDCLKSSYAERCE